MRADKPVVWITSDIWQFEIMSKEGVVVTWPVSGLGIEDAIENLKLQLGYMPMIFKASMIVPSALIVLQKPEGYQPVPKMKNEARE
jgi:hypothetical protein